ncbi:MAG: bifunctional metallophosphatase/5'-nucleotidase [Elusimicrobia bacterium]|nr:bifunctional metallophosphatase/5'-nucleotidase [Elusimicrobiota bacterium]
MRTALFFILLVLSVPARAAGIRLTILHTNDIHGWLLPRLPYFDESETKRLIGGAEALAAFSRKVPGPKLLLDAGDWYQGTPEGSLRGGRVMADFFNAAGYDALTVGNHEFDDGEANLRAIMKALRAPVLAANIYAADGKRAPGFKPWLVKEVGGVKVGLFGLANPNMRSLAFPEHIAGLEFRRGVDEAREAVAALRRQGATVVIAITHRGFEAAGSTGYEGDKLLAASVPGIDLIVGGHSHTVLQSGERDAAHGTLIVQAGSELVRAGETVLEIDPRTKKVVKSSSRLVDLWADETGPDAAMAGVVRRIQAEVGPIYDVVVGTAAAPLLRNRDGESSLGDWLTDCERDWAGADLALQNGGGIRADIPAGPVTLRRLYNVMPFENRVVRLVMRGKDVRSILDHGVGMARIAQISGAQVAFRRKAPEGGRLETVRVGGRDLVDASTYTFTTIDFLVKGGDGYTAFDSAVSSEFTKTRLRDVLQECVRKSPLLAVPAAGRLVPLGE